MLKEMRKVTSRNRAHRWRISSLRPRRASRFPSNHLALPCISRPPKTQSYVWLHVSLKNSSRVRKMSIVMIFESKKWTSAAGARGAGGERVREGPDLPSRRGPFFGPVSLHITPSPSLPPIHDAHTRMRTIRALPSYVHEYALVRVFVRVLNNAYEDWA